MADKMDVLNFEKLSDLILVTPDLRDVILEFVKDLEMQGILKLFVDGDSLDELVFLMNSLDILTGEFGSLDYCKSNLRNYYNSHFIRQIALKLCSLEANTEINLQDQIRLMLDLWKTPKHSSDLFLLICDLGAKLRKVYAAAIDGYVRQVMSTGLFIIPKSGDSEKIYNYWQEVTQNKNKLLELLNKALPLGIEDTKETLKWMEKKESVIKKIDFASLDGHIDFENTYYYFFGTTQVVGSGMTKVGVRSYVQKIFYALILNDVFSVLKNSKSQTSAKISNEIRHMIKTQEIRVNLRYVQAFFMFYREDARIVRERTEKKASPHITPFTTNGGIGGSNIPN